MGACQSLRSKSDQKIPSPIKIKEYITNSGLNITCYTGDVTAAGAEGIVTAEGCGMANPSMVTQSLLKMADIDYGDLASAVIRKFGTVDLKVGEVYCLQTLEYGIMLQFKSIFLAIVLPFEDARNKIYWKSHTVYLYYNLLNEAEKNGLKSLAIPLLGSGKAGAPLELAIEALVTALGMYQAKSLSDIMLVSFTEKNLNKITKQWDEYFAKESQPVHLKKCRKTKSVESMERSKPPPVFSKMKSVFEGNVSECNDGTNQTAQSQNPHHLASDHGNQRSSDGIGHGLDRAYDDNLGRPEDQEQREIFSYKHQANTNSNESYIDAHIQPKPHPDAHSRGSWSSADSHGNSGQSPEEQSFSSLTNKSKDKQADDNKPDEQKQNNGNQRQDDPGQSPEEQSFSSLTNKSKDKQADDNKPDEQKQNNGNQRQDASSRGKNLNKITKQWDEYFAKESQPVHLKKCRKTKSVESMERSKPPPVFSKMKSVFEGNVSECNDGTNQTAQSQNPHHLASDHGNQRSSDGIGHGLDRAYDDNLGRPEDQEQREIFSYKHQANTNSNESYIDAHIQPKPHPDAHSRGSWSSADSHGNSGQSPEEQSFSSLTNKSKDKQADDNKPDEQKQNNGNQRQDDPGQSPEQHSSNSLTNESKDKQADNKPDEQKQNNGNQRHDDPGQSPEQHSSNSLTNESKDKQADNKPDEQKQNNGNQRQDDPGQSPEQHSSNSLTNESKDKQADNKSDEQKENNGNQRQDDPGQSPEQQSSRSLINECKDKQADDNKPNEQKQNNGNQRLDDPGQSPEEQSFSSLTNKSKDKQADDNKPDEQKQNNGNQRQDDPGQSPEEQSFSSLTNESKDKQADNKPDEQKQNNGNQRQDYPGQSPEQHSSNSLTNESKDKQAEDDTPDEQKQNNGNQRQNDSGQSLEEQSFSSLKKESKDKQAEDDTPDEQKQNNGNQRQNDPVQSPEEQSFSSLLNESKDKQAEDDKPDEQKQNNGNQRQDDPGQSPDNSNTGTTIEDESIDFMLRNSKDNMNNDEPSPNFTASHEDSPMHSIEIISLPTSDNNDWEHLQVQQCSMSLGGNGCQSRHTPYTEESTNELASGYVFVGGNDIQSGVDLNSDVMHSEDNSTTGKTTEQNLTNSAHREGEHGESTDDSYTGKSAEETNLSGDEDGLSEKQSNAGKTQERDSSVGSVQEETKDNDKSEDTTEQTSSNMITGNQPPGKMSHKIIPDISCPGYDGHGVIVIDYNFEDGTQTVIKSICH
ncbi:uncharacterized protein DDB_G0287625-like [Gigantopelta aegis]|uniref:uncharacterized protein DDB_G0287625-like n=1 Tax=Gigantopelta aegis TaxID=1735272 RepID=UPI001B88D55E|nr:uncharacterized protein DDB_G0287625-like [Gigantopelta aegis]